VFFKRQQKTIHPKKQEVIGLIFFIVSFFIYGMASLLFLFHPETDPLRHALPKPSGATLSMSGLFFVYGIYIAVFRRSMAGKVLGGTIITESAVAFTKMLCFHDAAPQHLRLSGVIEGSVCFLILLSLLLAVRKGASIWR
jgi:hypothetical protein